MIATTRPRLIVNVARATRTTLCGDRDRGIVGGSVRSSWLVGALTIASLAWTGGATAHVGHHARAADCCYEIAYDQYVQVTVQYEARGDRAGMSGEYFASMGAHLRMLATAVTSPQWIQFIPVTEERTAFLIDDQTFATRTPAPNPSASPGPWKDIANCGAHLIPTQRYARVSGRQRDSVRIDRSQKRTEVVLGPPIRYWKFGCGEFYDGGQRISGRAGTPKSDFNNLILPISQSPDDLPLVNANGKAAVCHVAGYQQVELQDGDLVYQFKGTYSASIRIKKVPSGARKDEVRKLGKLQGQEPQWLPGIYGVGDADATGSMGPLRPDVPRTGCSRG